MNNAEIIRGIDLTIEGLTTIKNALAVADGAIAEAPKKTAKTGKAQTEAMNPPVEETEGSAEVMTGKFDVEQLKAMKYNDFKKLAASLGVKCTGTRDEIMELMKNADDRTDNMLVIDEDGYAKIIQKVQNGYLYPVSHEAWNAGNVYVGKYSNLSTLEDDYISSLQGWLLYLKYNRHVRMDYVHDNKDENELLQEIKKYY